MNRYNNQTQSTSPIHKDSRGKKEGSVLHQTIDYNNRDTSLFINFTKFTPPVSGVLLSYSTGTENIIFQNCQVHFLIK
jgi:hypothetical protein